MEKTQNDQHQDSTESSIESLHETRKKRSLIVNADYLDDEKLSEGERTAVLKELQKIIMLANDAGQAPESASAQKVSMLTGIMEALGATNAVDSETMLAKLEALLKQSEAAGENKLAAE